MSDNDKSGAPTPAPADLPAANPVPAEPASAAPAAALASTTPIGTFGSTRGSGLARGKRPTQPAASSNPAPASTGYKPTAVEVITPQSEYKNPFTGETTVVSAPAQTEPSARAVNEPAPAVQAGSPQVEITAPSAPTVANVAPKTEITEAGAATDTPAKSELKILPPEPAKRPALSWEAPAPDASATQPAPRRDERPTFRPDRERERRDQRPFEPREGREGRQSERKFEPREERKFEPRTNQPYRDRAPQTAPAKKGGFLGWLKGLFGGTSTAAGPATDDGARRGGDREHDGHRGHRGGRGRGHGGGYRGENRGPRPDGQFGGEGRPQGEGDHGAGHRRRRRRGGRGRGHGGGGGFRDESRGPRPEGQQGGGAI